MKHMRRSLAFLMAVLIAGGTLGPLAVATASAEESNDSSTLLYQESFELGQSMIVDESYSGTPQKTSSRPVIWNGAAPTQGSGIGAAWAEGYGTTILEGMADEAFHGGNSIRITPDEGRLALNISKDVNALQLVDGAYYVASVMIKSSQDVNYKVYLRVKNRPSGNPTIFKTPTTQWTKVDVVFRYDAAAAADKGQKLIFEIGLESAKSKGGAVYFDDLQLVRKIDATAISLDSTLTLEPGEELLLQPTLTPTNATTSITWTSSDPAVAQVEASGKVTALAAGTAEITATASVLTDEDKSATVQNTLTAACALTVTGTPLPENPVLVDESFENLTPKDTGALQASHIENGKQVIIWNGAEKPAGTLAAYVNEGEVTLEALVADAADGNYSIRLTPQNGRMAILYNLDAETISKMKAGATYELSVWLKAENSPACQVIMRPKFLKSGNPSTTVSLITQWTPAKYEFVYAPDGTTTVQLELGMSRASTGGSIYIDKLMLKRVDRVQSLTLSTEDRYLGVNQSFDLTYTIVPSEMQGAEVAFSSSDPSVATVDASGRVTAVAPGEVIITAATEGAQATCRVLVVEEYIELTAISILPELELNPGGQQTLSIAYTPENATDQRITWTSSAPEIVSVGEDGTVTAWAQGAAVITARSATGLQATCNVNVTTAAGLNNTQISKTVKFGHTTQIALQENVTYKILAQPTHGKLELTADGAVYTPYTWLMEKDGAFTDQQYADTAILSIQNAAGETAIVTLQITIGKLSELFYDENGWISNVDLMFSEEWLQSVRSMMSDTSSLRYELAQNLLSCADSLLKDVPVQYSKPDYSKVSASYDTNTRPTGDKTVIFLTAYLLTKGVNGYEAENAVYLEKTIQWVCASLSYPFWGTLGYQNNDLAAGHQLFSVAMVYHWLKDELQDVTCTHTMGTDGSSEERFNTTVVTYENQPILEAMRLRLWQAGRDMYSRNYDYKLYTMNHLHVRMGGLLAAATALRAAAVTETERQELVNWTGMTLYKAGLGMSLLMQDGTSQEGMPYWEYSTEWLMKTGFTVKAAFGIDLFSMTQIYEHSSEYVLYGLLPMQHWKAGGDGSVLDIGDSPRTHYYGPSQILRIIAALYGDTTAQWLAQQVENREIDTADASIWMSVFFSDPSVPAVEPSNWPTLKWFKDLDYVIARSDWSGNEDLLLLRCGPAGGKRLTSMVQAGENTGQIGAGHAHPDANHITLYSNGEYLLRDDGYAAKYTSNHSTLLVNGKGQVGEGDAWFIAEQQIAANAIPKVVKAESNSSYDYIVGDATKAYSADLGLLKFERNLVWLKDEKVLLAVDNVATSSVAALELRWFPETQTVIQSGSVFMMRSSKNNMNFYGFTKNGVATAFTKVPVYLDSGNPTSQSQRGALVQTLSGTDWQNAVAFSWNDSNAQLTDVKYLQGENGVHNFEVNGKIYTIDVTHQTVSVQNGTLNVEPEYDSTDSSIATVLLNGESWNGFDPETTQYILDRFWKTAELHVEAFPHSPMATVTTQWDNTCPGIITITCVSADGSNTTVYTINVTNSQNLLGIVNAESTITRDGYDLAWSYDGVITEKTSGTGFWTVKGLPTVTYDLGAVSRIQKIDLALHNTKSRDSYYDLLISEDGENWTVVVDDGTIAATAALSDHHSTYVTVVDNAELTARYVRINLRGNANKKDDASSFNGIQEISIYGQPLYTVRVEGGVIENSARYYAERDEVAVTAQIPEGYRFDGWEISGAEIIDSSFLKTVSFRMRNSNVRLSARFTKLPEKEKPATPPVNTGDALSGWLPVWLLALLTSASVACTAVIFLRKTKITR